MIKNRKFPNKLISDFDFWTSDFDRLLKNLFGVLRQAQDERNTPSNDEQHPFMLSLSKHVPLFFNSLLIHKQSVRKEGS